MSTLQIRNLPDEVYEALALRAERAHRSLNQQAIVELARIPELEARRRRLDTLRRLRDELGSGTPLRDPETLVREDRER